MKRNSAARSGAPRKSVAQSAVSAPVATEKPAGSTAEELLAEYVPCTLGDTLYRLKYTWQALKIASAELRRQGIAVSLMQGLDFRFAGPEMVAPLFFAFAYSQHPGLTYAEIDAAIHEGTALVAFDAVATAYVLGMPEPVKGSGKNPTEGQAQS